jgi:uracil phosphoribosyltransferase
MANTDLFRNAQQKTVNFELLSQTPYLLNLMTHLRDHNTTGSDFVRTTHQVAHLLLQQGILPDPPSQTPNLRPSSEKLIDIALNHVPVTNTNITTAAGASYSGLQASQGVCGISILRAGACLETPLRDCWRSYFLARLTGCVADEGQRSPEFRPNSNTTGPGHP